MKNAIEKTIVPLLPVVLLPMLLASGCGSDGSDANPDAGMGADGGGGGDVGASCVIRQVSTPPTTDDVTRCRFVADVPNGPAAADGLVDVPPANPNIRYVGRVDCSDPTAPRFAFPAVSIQARFQGDALDVRLRDNGGASLLNYVAIIIDGGTPTTLPLMGTFTAQTYQLARGLAPGEHTVELWKRTESAPNGSINSGVMEFLGFRIRDGGALTPLTPPTRRIEVIGDSITCGYGDEVSVVDPTNVHFTSEHENAYMTYGAITARALSADYAAVAYSGRGMARNVMGIPGDTLPQMYLRALPDDPRGTAWDVHRSLPDVVVINLGTNDYSPGGVDRGAFRCEYLNFLVRLRSYYPTALIIAAEGPMINDYYPAGESAWTNVQADVKDVVKARNDAGDALVKYLGFAQQLPPYGEDYHPTIATHQQMATALTAFIQQQLGW